jgi:hypothetical protein
MQNCLPLVDMRQGTTLVVPQMAHPDSGFSRCEIANNCKKDAGAKAHHLLAN